MALATNGNAKEFHENLLQWQNVRNAHDCNIIIFFLKFVDCVRMAIYKAYAHSHTYRYTQRIITKHSTKVTPIPNNDEKSKTFL